MSKTIVNAEFTLTKAAALMDRALAKSTGQSEQGRKLITYWSLATHSLPYMNTFPQLCLLGKMGTGKSQALKVIRPFSHKSQFMSLRGMTGAVFRDELAKLHEGTAIIEEADHAWKDSDSTFERLLSDRTQRDSAESALKQQSANGRNWETAKQKYFGATALHRRVQFNDAAIDGRTVFVRFKADHSRKYQEYTQDDPDILDATELLRDFSFQLPDVEQPDGVAARVFSSYKPLLGVAKMCEDAGFPERILPHLHLQTGELKEAQASEPDGLVLQAIVEAIYEGGSPQFANVKFSFVTDSIWRNHKFALQPRQVGQIARELGFKTKPSHGVTVIAPTPATLLSACEECDYTDEEIERLRADFVRGAPDS